jgi:RimJ/RimL family protein N-acetyltransferase
VSGQFGESPTFRSTGGANASASRFCDIQFMATELTDGVVSLRPPRPEDAADHLAGEDHEIAKWLSGGRSTMATVQSYIRSCEENWRGDGPRRAFGIFDCATNRLIGSIEANLAFPLLEPRQANVSYGVFPAWRGNGTALRALRLMGAYLKSISGMRQMVLRISCENAASLRVAEKSGFQLLGIFEEPEGRMVRYAFDLLGA